ncbi:MAG: universal stress protein [Phycisphaerae bacterium]
MSDEAFAMKNLHRLGVYLNDEPGDQEALAFAGLLARLARPKSIDCIHVRGLESPVETEAPEPETVRRLILDVLPAELAGDIEVHVSEATGLPEMLRTARDRDLDMIVVGRRLPHDQLALGSAFYRLARKTPCDVLVVPAGARTQLRRLLVLVDGSEHSRMALETALCLARLSGDGAQVLVQSVYGIPYGHRYTGMSVEEAVRHREALQRKRIDEFLGGVNTGGVNLDVVITCSLNTAAAAHDLASAKGMDAIVIGSRGATLPAIALLGATAERVLLESPVPVLVVKRKGETFRFLDAVLETFRAPG